MIQDEVNRVERIGIDSVSLEYGFRKCALDGRKAELVSFVALQNKTDKPITEPADAVIKNDWQSNRSHEK